MEASLIPAIQIDETVTARKRRAEYNQGEYSATVTNDCPCDGCSNIAQCRDQAMACESFVGWITKKKTRSSHQSRVHSKREPSQVYYRQYVA